MEPQIKEISFENVVMKYSLKPLGDHVAIDLYPLNGTSVKKFQLKHFLRPKHREEIARHLEHVTAHIDPHHQHLRIIVIDFKDLELDYKDRATIRKTEIAFLEKIQFPEIDYYLLEGSLKADLLLKSVEVQRLYLAEAGGQKLCQLCEVIMNLFKRGLDVTIQGEIYKPADYVHGAFKAGGRLVTLYSEHYSTTYSANSLYYECMKNNFNLRIENHGKFSVISID